MLDFENNEDFQVGEVAVAVEGEAGSKPDEVKKIRKNVMSYKANDLIEDVNGINHLFKTFTMHSETIDNLRGKGHEASDLNKIIGCYKQWHMQHNPRLEYYFFIEKVRNL